MLIDHREYAQNPKGEPTFPSPVVGSASHSYTPTSADVHLYADPDTYHGQRPVLYADCEGLDGGEEDPIAYAARKKHKRDPKKLVKMASGRVRHIAWANTESRCTRQFAVGELYPRLLYTFSDTVVFVLRNVK